MSNTKDNITKIKKAYALAQKLESVNEKIHYYNAKALEISEGKTDFKIDLLFMKNPSYNDTREDVLDRDGSIRKKFLVKGGESHASDSFGYHIEFLRNQLSDLTWRGQASVPTKLVKEEVITTESTALRILDVLVRDLKEERTKLTEELNQYV